MSLIECGIVDCGIVFNYRLSRKCVCNYVVQAESNIIANELNWTIHSGKTFIIHAKIIMKKSHDIVPSKNTVFPLIHLFFFMKVVSIAYQRVVFCREARTCLSKYLIIHFEICFLIFILNVFTKWIKQTTGKFLPANQIYCK